MKHYILFGNSKKIYDALSKTTKNSKIDVIPWRINKSISPNFFHKKQILIICGFDHSCYHKGFNYFFNANVTRPSQILNNSIKVFKYVVYIDTMNNNYQETFSFYYYSKYKFRLFLQSKRPDLRVVEMPLVTNKNGWPDFYASFIEKLLAFLISRTKKINTLAIDNIYNHIIYDYKIAEHKTQGHLALRLKWLPRTRFFDKVLRTIFG
jgi:hypothetical protein